MAVFPQPFQDPFGLARRLLRSRDRHAYFAMALTAGAVLTAPLDAALGIAERRRYARAPEPHLPIVFVTGAPRSGTTVVEQLLGHNLPVAYLSNLTDLFPRAPLVAARLFGRAIRKPEGAYESYYGRVAGLAAPNDALKIWDRWWGPSRYVVPERFEPETAADMRRFFGACEASFGRPLLSKNNGLSTCASQLLQVLPTAHVIIVVREPLYNAQSILVAREKIQGSRELGYGVDDPARPSSGDPFAEVCAQVLYQQRRAREQQREMGEKRLSIVRYEDVCRDPAGFVAHVGEDLFRVPCDRARLQAHLQPLHETNRPTLPRPEFERLSREMARLTEADPTPFHAPGEQRV